MSRQLLRAEDRRSDVIAAALTAFATSGYFGTNTTEIASAAGISQPYLYRLYSNKEALFVATLEAAKDLIGAVIAEQVAAAPRGEAVGATLTRIALDGLPDHYAEAARVMLHAVGAVQIEQIGIAVRECFESQFGRLAELGATQAEIHAFLAWSQYANVMRAVGMTPPSTIA